MRLNNTSILSVLLGLLVCVGIAAAQTTRPVVATWSGESGKHCVGAVRRAVDSLVWPDAQAKIAEAIAKVPADKPLVVMIVGGEGNLTLAPAASVVESASIVWPRVFAARKPAHVAGDLEYDAARINPAHANAVSLDPIRAAAPGVSWSNFAMVRAGQQPWPANALPAPVAYLWDGGKPVDALTLMGAQLDRIGVGDVPWLGDANVASAYMVPYLPSLDLHAIARCGGGLMLLFDDPASAAIAKAARDRLDASIDRWLAETGGVPVRRIVATRTDTYAVSTVVQHVDGSFTAIVTRRAGPATFSFPGVGKIAVPEQPVSFIARKAV